MIPRWASCWLIGGNGRRPGYSGFWVEWMDRGGHKRRRKFNTLDQARRARKHIETHLNEWVMGEQSAEWADLVAVFMGRLSSASDSHRSQVARTLRGLGPLKGPASFTADAVRRFLDGLTTDAKRHKAHRHLTALGNWLVRNGYLATSPMAQVERVAIKRRAPRAPSIDDISALLSHVANESVPLHDRQGWYLLILLAYVTGFRQKTLLGLKLSDIDIGGPSGVAIVTAVESKTKQEERRALPACVCNLISRRLTDLPERSVLFFGWDLWQRHSWDRLKGAAGFKFSFHDLRRASGTAWAIARLKSAGAQHLEQSSPHLFSAHYGERLALAIAAAESVRIPELPPLPRFDIATPTSPGHSPSRSAASAPQPKQRASRRRDAGESGIQSS